jgi:antitoxin YefM
MYNNEVFTMKALSYTALRNTLAKTMEKVCEDHEPIVITRKSEGAVVMLSLEDYESLEETTYLLRSPKNVKRLFESISQIEEGKGLEKDLDE